MFGALFGYVESLSKAFSSVHYRSTYYNARSLLTFSLSQSQTKSLKLGLTFNLDRPSIVFGTALSMQDGNHDRKSLSNAVRPQV